jgi:hypothetical protein
MSANRCRARRLGERNTFLISYPFSPSPPAGRKRGPRRPKLVLLLEVRAGREVRSLPLGLLFCYTITMKKSRTVKQKVIGRPRTGITPLMGFRADPATRARIVRWAENQPDMPSLSEAIRRLVEIGLRAKTK